ncbi:hypothetical protein PM082_013341 [Marasmius tenuissimus]|nr:hypothetical protein PM082_013341 [Marasmius tenuissimus]
MNITSPISTMPAFTSKLLALPGTQSLSVTLTPYALALNLQKLPENLPTVLSSLFLFTFVQLFLSPWISSILSSTYRTGLKTRRQRQRWHMHVVSQIHASIVVPLALSYLRVEALNKDRLYGWDETGAVGTLQAISVGYFAWDLGNELILFDDVGFVVHGAACLAIYVCGFTPFLSYFAIRCLLWETSTFFLNIHWFLDKTKQTGSTLQFVNGVFLLASFFFVRLCHGMYTSYQFWRAIQGAQLSYSFYLIFCAGNIALNGLNVMWFGKMINALKKRFSGPSINGYASGNGKAAVKTE